MMRLLRTCAYTMSQAKANPAYPTYNFAKDIPEHQERVHWNLFQAVNSAIDIALETDSTYLLCEVGPKCSVKMSNSEESSGAQ